MAGLDGKVALVVRFDGVDGLFDAALHEPVVEKAVHLMIVDVGRRFEIDRAHFRVFKAASRDATDVCHDSRHARFLVTLVGLARGRIHYTPAEACQ